MKLGFFGIPAGKALCLFVSTLSTGCSLWDNTAVKVKIAFTETNDLQQLANVSVIAGGEKFFWHYLDAGEVKTVTLAPGPRNDRQLTVLYRLDGEKKVWEGPKFSWGTGYRIEVNIDGRGNVTHRHCLLPCRLD